MLAEVHLGKTVLSQNTLVSHHENSSQGKRLKWPAPIWGWLLTAVLAELTMASMRLFRDEWNTVAHRIVATPTGLNVLAGTALFLLVSVVWLSLHYFDLAYQRYELTAKHTSAQPT